MKEINAWLGKRLNFLSGNFADAISKVTAYLYNRFFVKSGFAV